MARRQAFQKGAGQPQGYADRPGDVRQGLPFPALGRLQGESKTFPDYGRQPDAVLKQHRRPGREGGGFHRGGGQGRPLPFQRGLPEPDQGQQDHLRSDGGAGDSGRASGKQSAVAV